MRFTFIRDHAGTWPIRLMCRVLQVSASGYYAWRDPLAARQWPGSSPSARRHRHLLGDIRRLEAEHRGRYGSPRMHAALRAEGRTVSRGRVARLMRHSTAFAAWQDVGSSPARRTAATTFRSRRTC